MVHRAMIMSQHEWNEWWWLRLAGAAAGNDLPSWQVGLKCETAFTLTSLLGWVQGKGGCSGGNRAGSLAELPEEVGFEIGLRKKQEMSLPET